MLGLRNKEGYKYNELINYSVANALYIITRIVKTMPSRRHLVAVSRPFLSSIGPIEAFSVSGEIIISITAAWPDSRLPWFCALPD